MMILDSTVSRSFTLLAFFQSAEQRCHWSPILTILLSVWVSIATAEESSVVWPQWRGESMNGVAPATANLPTTWDATSQAKSPNWTISLPGSGGSTPVVVDSTAFLTAGVDGKNTLMAIDLQSGETRWKQTIGDDAGGKHRKGSGSNPSPVTDGKHVAAYFRSGDLAVVDTTGTVAWQVNLQKEFGEDTLWWDLGSSPALIDGMVVVAVMQTGPSYLVAYDLATGEQRWKVDRITDAPQEAAQSYITPLHVTVKDQSMIAVMGADHLTLHRADNGTEVGRLGGFNPDGEIYFRSIASPVAEGNLIICPYARGATLTAVRLDKLAAGETSGAIAWFRDDIGTDVPTPAMKDGVVYMVSDAKENKGTVFALSAETGETLWTVELPRTRISYSSSVLLANDHLFITGEDSRTSIVGPLSASSPSVIATNELRDTEPFTVASPVPLSDGILIRTRFELAKIQSR